MKPLTILTVKDSTKLGKYQYNLMEMEDGVTTHLHINEVVDLDSKGKNRNSKNSVMVPVSAIQELFRNNKLVID